MSTYEVLKQEKYLIIHMDDMGTSYAANIPGIRLFKKGIANRASVIVSGPGHIPCRTAWF